MILNDNPELNNEVWKALQKDRKRLKEEVERLKGEITARDRMIDGLKISHSDLLQEAKFTADELGACDHSVGICLCELYRKIESGEKLENKTPDDYREKTPTQTKEEK